MKTIKFTTLIISLIFLISCNDSFLERYPLSELTPETYFTTENELKAYTNNFYTILPNAYQFYYDAPFFGDDIDRTFIADQLVGTRTIPNIEGGWNWTTLRKINFFLENSSKCPDPKVRAKYDGVARFFRAYFYFDKVQRFGDVPWYDRTMQIDDEQLYKGRDSRKVVIKKMIEDLDYAIQNLDVSKNINLITKWTALALKSRICLFEGTFRKYHGISEWEELLDLCANAGAELMNNSGYKIYSSTPNNAYLDLFAADNAIADEIILSRQYSATVPFSHQLNWYILSNSYGRPGLTRQLVNTYLNADGTRFTDNPSYKTMQWFEECQNRDPRLSQTIRTPGYKRIGDSKISLPILSACVTGYQIVKYIQPASFDNTKECYNDMPVFRFAEVLLNYAEAKAELGTITQNDLNLSIKLLRDRVKMPNMDLSFSNQNPDPYIQSQYRNVSGANQGVILEIRRERRIELFLEGLRWNDVLRWREGHLFTEVYNGMYFPGLGKYDLDHDGTIDLVLYEGEKPQSSIANVQYMKLGEVLLENGSSGGQIVVKPNVSKKWDENKDYLYPIPIQERLLNPKLTQNLGWVDGINN